MGYIKEPKGVDFIIKSDPLTDKARAEISEFISNYKKERALNKTSSGKVSRRRKQVPTLG